MILIFFFIQSFKVKIYEASHSLKIQCESFQKQVEALTQDLHSREEEVAHYCKVS